MKKRKLVSIASALASALKTFSLLALTTILLSGCTDNGNSSYDLVIANGRVIDPQTQLDAVRHLGINGAPSAQSHSSHCRALMLLMPLA